MCRGCVPKPRASCCTRCAQRRSIWGLVGWKCYTTTRGAPGFMSAFTTRQAASSLRDRGRPAGSASHGCHHGCRSGVDGGDVRDRNGIVWHWAPGRDAVGGGGTGPSTENCIHIQPERGAVAPSSRHEWLNESAVPWCRLIDLRRRPRIYRLSSRLQPPASPCLTATIWRRRLSLRGRLELAAKSRDRRGRDSPCRQHRVRQCRGLPD